MIDIRQGIKSLAKVHAPRREGMDLVRKLPGPSEAGRKARASVDREAVEQSGAAGANQIVLAAAPARMR